MLAIIPITPFAVMAFAMGVGILLDTFLVRSCSSRRWSSSSAGPAFGRDGPQIRLETRIRSVNSAVAATKPGEEAEMNTAAPETAVTRRPAGKSPPRTTGLRREIGFIGLIWASVGSIIGSGWLFGAQKALVAAGPAAIISWVIGAVAILLLALVHAELGGMFPVSGGTARFPHYAFGGAAGASFGWFSWLQAATVAPIEVLAMISYGQHYSFAQRLAEDHQRRHDVLTASGIVVAVVLMAIFMAVNFLGVRKLAHTNSAATWWKVGVPLLTIFVLAIANFHASNFTAADGFNPYGAKGILAAVSTSGIIFALLGFEQADQLAGESRNPKRDIPRAVIGSVVIGAVIYIALQIVFIGALPSVADRAQLGDRRVHARSTGPFAQVATLRRPRLARDDPLHRRRHLARRHRPDLHHRDLAGLLRAEPQRLLPEVFERPTAAACRGSA